MPGPLDGVRVLEVSQIIAGPYCAMNLADLGAEVVKLEPPHGDGMRLIGQFAPGESKIFHSLNRGKRGIVVDLRQAAGQELVHRVVSEFDVFIINSRPGLAARLRIDYDTLRQFRRDLVYMENTGYGATGPSAERSGSDVVAQAYSGLMAAEGKVDEHGAPQQATTPLADLMSGMAGALGIVAALYRRSLSGEGEFIETSLLATAMSAQCISVGRLPAVDVNVLDPLLEAIRETRARGGSYADVIECRSALRGSVGGGFSLYYGGYSVRDGGIILGAVTPANRNQLRRALGIDDDPTDDPDFNALDPANQELVERLRERIRALLLTRTADEWMERFDREGAPASTVSLPEEMADDPQVEALGLMLDLEHAVSGPERMMGPVLKLRSGTGSSELPSPPLGGHTDEVLSELGLSAEELAALREARTIA